MGRTVASCVLVLFLLTTSAFSQGLPVRPDCRTGSITFGANVGWVEHYGGFAHSFELEADGELYTEKAPLRGVWLGLFGRGTLPSGIGLELSGGLLVRGTMGGEDRENVEPSSYGFKFGEVSWGIVEGLASYNVFSDLQVIGGLRWDHLSTQWEYLTDPSTLDLTINAYLPVIGLQVTQGFFQGELTTRVTGWPGPVFGDLKYHYNGILVDWGETANMSLSEGYFLECYMEFARRIFGESSLGLYAKWNVTNLQTREGSYDWRQAGTFDEGSDPMAMTNYRHYWILGGLFSVDFNLSDLGILR